MEKPLTLVIQGVNNCADAGQQQDSIKRCISLWLLDVTVGAHDNSIINALQSALQAKIRDPDADDSPEQGGRDPPNIFWRVAAALMYIIPWIDVIALGREVYHHFPSSIILFLFPGIMIF